MLDIRWGVVMLWRNGAAIVQSLLYVAKSMTLIGIYCHEHFLIDILMHAP